MKYLKFVTLFLIGSLFFIKCTSSKEKNTVTAHQDNIQLIYRYNLDKIDTVLTKKNQAVAFNFDEELQNGMLFHPKTNTRIPLYLGNNKTNSVIIDSLSNRQLYFHYNGENAPINQYILKSFDAQQMLMRGMQDDYPSFKAIINKAVSLRRAQLDSLSDEDFKKIETITIDYLPKNLKLTYAFQHALREQKNVDSIDSEITQLINEKPIEDPSLLKSDSYKNYLNMMSQINFFKTNPDLLNSIYDHLIYSQHYFQNEEIIATVGENLINLYLKFTKDTSHDNEVKDFINQYITKTAKKEQFLNQFKERNKFSKGQTAPTFSGIDINGKTIHSTDLKGKYLVVDVWATWCGPCIKEAPFFKKLAEQYKNDDRIEFISISIDQNKKAWEKFLQKEKPSWLNLWVENDFQSSLALDYEIKGIPYFMIIDPDGKFATSSASRPSDKMGEQITHLLK
ncbi:thioredoxin-like protein YneN [Flavobacteriaceae bacterium UJ101]|nr:thioredoxin-like protein YneN [Flavobacteriaceae bacterium UJ101]